MASYSMMAAYEERYEITDTVAWLQGLWRSERLGRSRLNPLWAAFY